MKMAFVLCTVCRPFANCQSKFKYVHRDKQEHMNPSIDLQAATDKVQAKEAEAISSSPAYAALKQKQEESRKHIDEMIAKNKSLSAEYKKFMEEQEQKKKSYALRVKQEAPLLQTLTTLAKNHSSAKPSAATTKQATPSVPLPTAMAAALQQQSSLEASTLHYIWFFSNNKDANSRTLEAVWSRCQLLYKGIKYFTYDCTVGTPNAAVNQELAGLLNASPAPSFVFWNRTQNMYSLINPRPDILESAIQGWNY